MPSPTTAQAIRAARRRARSEAELSRSRQRLLGAGRAYRDHQECRRAWDGRSESWAGAAESVNEDDIGLLKAVAWGPLLLCTVLVIDFILIASYAEFLIGMVHSSDAATAPVWAKALVTAAFVALEILVGIWMAHAVRTLRDTGEGWWPAIVTCVSALAVVTVVPSFAGLTAATHLDNLIAGESASLTEAMRRPVILGVIVASVLAHGLVIYGAERALASFSYLGLSGAAAYASVARGHHDRRARSSRDTTQDAFTRLAERVQGFTGEYGPLPPWLGFQRADRALINTALGWEAFDPAGTTAGHARAQDHIAASDDTASDTTGATEQPGQQDGQAAHDTEPGTARGDAAEQEANYLRRIIDAQIRDADGEVTPSE